MLFYAIVSILAFIVFTGAVLMVIVNPAKGINEDAIIALWAVVGVVVMAFVFTSIGMGFAGVAWASFGVVSLTIGVMALCDVV